jgi:hypothetical protein
MPPEMAKQAERLGKKNGRTMSELLEYIREIAPTPPAYKAIREEASRKGTEKLTMRQIDREIAAAGRERTTKRSKRCSK